MPNILDNLTTAIQNLESCVKKDLAEIRNQKKAIQQMQDNIRMSNPNVQYVRDDNCLILSAPRIIIGNVDKNGVLMPGASTVVIRGNKISSEATGSVEAGGSITNRATTIRNIAVDPGTDGRENVVMDGSKIINQARAITLQSNDELGAFSVAPHIAKGVTILSDTKVDVNALAQNKERKKAIDSKIKDYQKKSQDAATLANQYKDNLIVVIDNIKQLVTYQGEFNSNLEDLATSYQELYGTQHDAFKQQEELLYTMVANYIACLSDQAEAERSITALKATKDALNAATQNFDTESTATSISLNSELVKVSSVDGDGSIRENASAGVDINASHVTVKSINNKRGLIKDSNILMTSQNIMFTTQNATFEDGDSDNFQYPAEGEFSIVSKKITIDSIDEENKDGKFGEKALTKGGTFHVRAETIDINATDTEGKSSGSLSLNAKLMNIAAVDVDKDTREEKDLAPESILYLQADKNFIGHEKSTELTEMADKIAIISKTMAEMSQEENAVVTLKGGNLTAGGTKVEINGDTTISGNAEITGETKTPKLTSDEVKAAKSIETPSITDKQGVGITQKAKKTETNIKTKDVNKNIEDGKKQLHKEETKEEPKEQVNIGDRLD